jgi:hypothetical protein
MGNRPLRQVNLPESTQFNGFPQKNDSIFLNIFFKRKMFVEKAFKVAGDVVI